MKELIKKIKFSFVYFGIWVLYFQLTRILFIVYYSKELNTIPWNDILQIPIYGAKLDASLAGYLSIIPFLIITISFIVPNRITKILLKLLTFPLIYIINLLMFFDLGLYGHWGIRIDSTPLIYLNTPKEMLASVPLSTSLIVIFLWLISATIFAIIFNKIINKNIENQKKSSILYSPVLLLITGSLILVMRGGLQTIPINQSNVYFSNHAFANHAAVNFAWNFMHSLNYKQYDNTNPYVEMDSKISKNIFKEAKLNIKQDSSFKHLLNTTKPNIILIVWESLTGKIIAPLGGEKEVTSEFNKLATEGILFDQFYANGDRSDKGMTALLSGYYPQPQKSIIKIPSKSRSLPMLPQKMADLGYDCSFYHGGDLNFGNMNTYIRNGGITNIIEGGYFNNSDWNSKWGVHDHILLEKLMNDIKQRKNKKPFFDIVFTITSHEPFEFPGQQKFGMDTEENKFRSAHAYTDRSVNAFINEAKKQTWWDNTLIIITADHGHPMPKVKGSFNGISKYHVPMLWIGGALNKKDTIISNICSQVDFGYSLLHLLNGDNKDFTWSNNMFQKSDNNFAHYIFNNGFGTINKYGNIGYDYYSKKVIFEVGDSTNNLLLLGKAITQSTYQDYLSR